MSRRRHRGWLRREKHLATLTLAFLLIVLLTTPVIVNAGQDGEVHRSGTRGRRARGRRAGHQRVQVQLVSDDQPTPISKEEVTSVYDDR